jgi:DNA repair protein RadC
MIESVCMIRELAETERPRERLLDIGSQALSDAELVAVVLRTGREGVSVLDLSRELLRDCGGLPGLVGATGRSLQRRGLGPAKAASLLAALEIGRRLARAELPDRPLMGRPSEVATYLALRYCCLEQEVMGALFLDTKNHLVAEREIFRGTLSRTAVEPRPVLKQGLLCDAAGVLLFHTHPSGDPNPSAEDLLFTRRMAQAGDLMGMRLVDHLVVAGTGRWVSLRQRKAW